MIRARRLAGLAALMTSAAFAAGAFAQTATTEVADVIVRGAPLRHGMSEVATPVATLTGQDLVHQRQATIGETLQGIPGVQADTFGGGVSRPVIRGQGAPRVKVLSDSAEVMDASAISPDHAIAAEPLLLKGVEVFRGPSALVFGGGAISGAVNLIDERVPTAIPTNGVAAVAEVRAGDNGGERAGVAGVTVGGGSFAAHAEVVRRLSTDYETPLGVVDGSFNRTHTLSFGGSWIGARGYLGAAFTRQGSQYGLPGHEHGYEDCHPHGDVLHCGNDDPTAPPLEMHEVDPFVYLESQRFDLRGELSDPLPGFSQVRLRASQTDYHHDEYDDGVVATVFSNQGHDVRLEAEHRPWAGWHGVIGLQTTRSEFSALGLEAFLPASTTDSRSLFVFEERDWDDWHFEFAVRREELDITGDGLPTKHFEPTSVSASALWTPAPGWSAALAVSRSQRAPTAQELFADGLHLATNTYEVGDPDLEEETARTADVTLRRLTGPTTFTVALYHHRIADYIFADTIASEREFRLIHQGHRDATFTGLDVEIERALTPKLSATVFGDYVRARFDDGGGDDLPRIPPARLGARMEREFGDLKGEVEYYHAFDQTDVAPYEEPTPGFDMVNATLAWRLPTQATNSQIYLRGTNLLDDTALNHASFISRAAPLRGRAFVLGVRATF
jgi:iron complex outermembrane receptor protein